MVAQYFKGLPMRKTINLIILLSSLCLIAAAAHAQPPVKPSQAIVKGRPDNVFVDVTLGKEFKTITGEPRGGLYQIDKDGNEIEIVGLPRIGTPFRIFRIDFPRDPNPLQYNPDVQYQVLVLVPSVHEDTGAAITLKKVIEVQEKFSVRLTRDDSCENGIYLRISSPVKNQAIWPPVFTWLNQFNATNNAKGIATVKIRETGSLREVENSVKSIRFVPIISDMQTVAGRLAVCVTFENRLPTTDFKATFKFNGPNLPPEFTAASDDELSGEFAVDFPKDEEITSPEKRTLERNLDLGLTFTSEVADKTIPKTDTTPEMTVRGRTSRGVLDVRFAPWIDLLHPVIRSNRWLFFLTPVYLNANVATGKIEKETLALNRVLFEVLETEARYYQSKTDASGTKSYPFWHRFVFGATHASDRDFKQKEFTGKLEYYLILEKLYKPYVTNWSFDAEGFKHQKWYGFTFQPMVGFQIGKTYSRRNPAEAIEPSDTVTRVSFGGEVAFDLTAYATLSFTDDFYTRFESSKNRYKNYFKTSGEFRLGRSADRSFAHSLFATFERGQQPPFASADANSFRIGYRVQASFCGQFCR
jgi:hypothetical protein